MLKLITVIALIISLAQCRDYWTQWNNITPQRRAYIKQYSPPPIPYPFTRYQYNQYRYVVLPYYFALSNPSEISIFCGPRSFLTQVGGFLLCLRDKGDIGKKEALFYGELNLKSQHCIPNTVGDLSKVGRTQLNYGNCQQQIKDNIPQLFPNFIGISCCYDSQPKTPNGDLQKIVSTSNRKDLRTLEV